MPLLGGSVFRGSEVAKVPKTKGSSPTYSLVLGRASAEGKFLEKSGRLKSWDGVRDTACRSYSNVKYQQPEVKLDKENT